MKRVLFATVWLLDMTCSAFALPAIDVGDHILLPNTPDQTVVITVHGGDQVYDLGLSVQVGDGGVDSGGIDVGPQITGAELANGTIFQGNARPQEISILTPHRMLLTGSVSTADGGTVTAEGTLAFVTFDTTGFNEGTWDLRLADTANGNTDFEPTQATITNGTLTVPEPASLGVLALGGLLLGRRRATSSRPRFMCWQTISDSPKEKDTGCTNP